MRKAPNRTALAPDGFEEYLRQLAQHEAKKSAPLLQDPRESILVNAGVRLNALGDFLTDSTVEWRFGRVPIDAVTFGSTTPEWNDVFLRRCSRSTRELLRLLERDVHLRERIEAWATHSDEPLLLKRTEAGLRVLDGMHRFVGAVLRRKATVPAFVEISGLHGLPRCEPHVVYDLIRGYQTRARNASGRSDLQAALRLMCRAYCNVQTLLRERFDAAHLPDPDVQQVILAVVSESARDRSP